MAKKVVLAYSGGLDTSIIIPWLKENYDCEVIAYIADVGQDEDLKAVEQKAIASGASEAYTYDLKEEFVTDFAYQYLKTSGLYEKTYLLGTALSRPLIARKQIELAEEVGADAVSHGATGKGNDQVRFEITYKVFSPGIEIIAPWRIWNIKSRSESIEYARARNIPVTATVEKPYSMDQNLWHVSYEGGILEDPWFEPDNSMFLTTVAPEDAPDKPEYVEIAFEKGIPVELNGERKDPVAMITELNRIAGKNGVGRVDMVENRLVGIKSRGVYETPAGTVLYYAHIALESITLDRDLLMYKSMLSEKYAELVYNGLWYSPLKTALDSFMDVSQSNVSGRVRMKLYKGNCSVVGRKSQYSMYNSELATFEADEIYNQKDVEGFIKLFALKLLGVESEKERLAVMSSLWKKAKTGFGELK
jgi:argininosuccinate synthase